MDSAVMAFQWLCHWARSLENAAWMAVYWARSQPQLGWWSGARKPGRADGPGLLLGLELGLKLWLDWGLELEALIWVWGSKELGDGDPRSWWFISSNRWMPKLPP